MAQIDALAVSATAPRPRIFIRSGLKAALFLGALAPALALALIPLSQLAHMSEPVRGALALSAVAGGLLLGGGLWGRTVARTAGYPHTRRLAVVGAIAFTLSFIVAAQVLGGLEQLFVEERAAGNVPVHIIFAIIFTAASFVVSGVVSLTLAGVMAGRRTALKLALASASAAALTFLAATVVQDLLGRRVGGPGAERTLTMVSVMLIGNLLAAFVGGGVFGSMLAARAGEAGGTGETMAPEGAWASE